MKYRLFCKLALPVVFSFVLCFPSFALDAIPVSVSKIMDTAAEKTADEAISFLTASAKSASVPAEKRLILSYLASLLEQMGKYSEASSAYAEAASLPGDATYGKTQLSSEQLVMNAIRSSLSCGDTATADAYMASAVKNSKNEYIASYLRLYSVWSRLCKIQAADELTEPLVVLSSYADMNSMNSVRPAVLLTLWFLTGSSEYSDTLLRDFPNSVETAVTQGNASLLPAPFWYFVPRTSDALTATEAASSNVNKIVDPAVAKSSSTVQPELSAASGNSSVSANSSVPCVKQQLGLFRDKENAQRLVSKLKEKGFEPQISSETRSSGTVYYIVTVDEDSEMSIGMKLKNAGFECYPVYPE